MADVVLKRQTIEMWGSTYEFTPALVTEIFGDGKQFIKFFPMNYRPLFYLIRVDSGWDEDSSGENPIVDHTDEIWEAIEDEFGVCCEERGDCECDGYELFPTTSCTSGCVWATLSERDVKKLGFAA